ncbi:MAG TPA: acyltransferase [Actinocrinis sp.]|jgi:peptidoglycan/LPS O-acetylase OafA/YrhL
MVQAARPENAENDGSAVLLAQTPARRLGRRPALDGVRGLAVLLVVGDHAHVPLGELWIGVELFFVLSGFLITSLLIEELDRTGRISVRSFYARRARRILPDRPWWQITPLLLAASIAAAALSYHLIEARFLRRVRTSTGRLIPAAAAGTCPESAAGRSR